MEMLARKAAMVWIKDYSRAKDRETVKGGPILMISLLAITFFFRKAMTDHMTCEIVFCEYNLYDIIIHYLFLHLHCYGPIEYILTHT